MSELILIMHKHIYTLLHPVSVRQERRTAYQSCNQNIRWDKKCIYLLVHVLQECQYNNYPYAYVFVYKQFSV